MIEHCVCTAKITLKPSELLGICRKDPDNLTDVDAFIDQYRLFNLINQNNGQIIKITTFTRHKYGY